MKGTFPSVAVGLSTAVTMLELIIYLVPQVAPDLHFHPFKIDGSLESVSVDVPFQKKSCEHYKIT